MVGWLVDWLVGDAVGLGTAYSKKESRELHTAAQIGVAFDGLVWLGLCCWIGFGLVGRCIGWFIGWLVHWLVGSLVGWFIGWSVG